MKRKKKGEILVYREPKKMAGKAAGGRFNSFGKGSYVRRVFESSSEEETSSDDVLTLSQLIEARRASPTSPAVDKGKKEVTELGRIEVSATEDRKEETPRAANCSGPLGDAAPVSPAPAKTQAKFISSELPNDIRFSIADAFSMEEYQQKIASTDNATLGAQVVSASLKNLLDQRTLVQRVEELGRDCVGQKCEITQLNEKLCKSQWELGALEGKLMLAKRENEAMKGDLRARKVMCQLLLSLFRGAKNENKQLQSRVQSLEESSPNAIVGYKKSLECRQIQLNRMKDGWEALAGGLLREQKISSDKIRGLDFIGCLQTVGESEYAEERFNVSDRTVQRLFDALEAAGEGEDAPE
ncbi:hypothetical protein AXF42_Ash013531 [Apostasia shenzhenica]|uniref:Uncharacterized protein n=1 Tax=Apostasia shenzhenica TaxID=1088818 RepID=A0A2I0AP91_9ASPA|nr:hypothetical protein AXF42_Ash013531 [Apostasia shenzhenica]